MLNKTVSLHSLELFLIDLPQKSVFQSGIGTRKSKETLIVKWTDQEGRVGYGECSCRPDPYYSAEFLAASYQLIQKFIAPKLKKTQTFSEIRQILKQVRGWNFTKSAIESAVFQIIKQNDSESSFLKENLKANPIQQIPVGISLGIYQDKQQFFEVVKEAVEDGYERVKFKISPTANLDFFDYVNPLLFENKVTVSFDANGSYRADDLDKLRYFVDNYDAYIEQPTPPDRFDVLLRMKEMMPTIKICFDEEVKNIGDVMKLDALHLLDELNLKIGRVGGISNSIEIMNYCFDKEIRCWIGGMFETGIGRLQNLELAAFLPNATAHDLSPSSRYFKEDLVAPAVEMQDGFIDLKSVENCEVDITKIEKYTIEKVLIKY